MKILFSVILIFCCSYVFAQTIPVQNMYFVNQYIYNPASLGKSDTDQFFASFKKQWIGVDGSPTIASLTYEKIFDERVSFGGTMNVLSEGPFNSVNALASASYELPISDFKNQKLRFGLSLGVNWNYVNVNRFDDPSDPALGNYTGSSILIDGAFGFSYTYDQIEVGFSSPRLSESGWFVQEPDGSTGYAPLDRLIFSGSYKYYTMGSKLELQPFILFHYDEYFQNQLEGMLLAKYNDLVQVGAGYRQHYGANFMIGLELGEQFNFNYFYTLSSANTALPQDSHELVFGYRL